MIIHYANLSFSTQNHHNTPYIKCGCSKIRTHSMHESIVTRKFICLSKNWIGQIPKRLNFLSERLTSRFWETSCLKDKTFVTLLNRKWCLFCFERKLHQGLVQSLTSPQSKYENVKDIENISSC